MNPDEVAEKFLAEESVNVIVGGDSFEIFPDEVNRINCCTRGGISSSLKNRAD
jgi:hypothetical protein